MALDGGRVVGHVYVQREQHPVTRHVATLGIAVAADRRGRGIGTALMAEAFRWARSVGVEKLVLSVYPHNDAAIALYRRFGFVEEGRLVAPLAEVLRVRGRDTDGERGSGSERAS